jgi:large conductance mechanosensitive channel
MPLVGVLFKSGKFENLTFQIHGSVFGYGDLFNALVSFIIIATVVYFLIVAPMAVVAARRNRHVEATERDCPECLSSIPIAATRCKYCTSQVPPVVRR